MSVDKDEEKLEPLCTINENVNWCSHKENSMDFPPEIKIELPYDPAIPLLATYAKELEAGSQRDFSIPRFIEALFTIAKIESNPSVQ